MQGIIALLIGGSGGLLIWALVAQRKVVELRKEFGIVVDAQQKAESIRQASKKLENESKKTANAIIAGAQKEAEKIRQSAKKFEDLSKNNARTIIGEAKQKSEKINQASRKLENESKKTANAIISRGKLEVKELEIRANKVKQHINSLESKKKETQHELDAINEAIALKKDDVYLLEVGYFESRHEFEDIPSYEAALRDIKEEQKLQLRVDGSTGDRDAAAFCTELISFNNSTVQGRAMIKKILKLMLRAFNGECDSFIARVTYKNILTMERRIEGSFNQINKLGGSWYCHLSRRYLENRVKELQLTFSYEEAKQKEREEQAQIREQMREEQRALREIERAREQAEKDESKYSDMLQKARQEVEQASEKDKIKMAEKIAKLEALLADAEANRQRAISQAQMTRSGYVYVISNIGSFGDNVYKIGMTRRLEPMERVRELGDASVPFPFDVHALIFTDDAPSLESELHRRFSNRRLNLENLRKEFFRVSIEEIRDELLRIHHEKGLATALHITLAAEAKQYYLSETKRKDLERIYSGEEASGESFF
ncbi:DUF4041 domain-containing protein [Nodosilinea sp. AN01ver1]|uniref:DUF4041 domain-containing protein n=1 Tax=Nodosilinea sp. AN01ver1 TaxID=3423362 RepID=UPI003D313C91